MQEESADAAAVKAALDKGEALCSAFGAKVSEVQSIEQLEPEQPEEPEEGEDEEDP